MSKRLVIVLAGEARRHELANRLERAEWRALKMAEFETLPAAARREVRVGVVALNEGKGDRLPEVEEWMARAPEVEWIALVERSALSCPATRTFLRHRCFDFHTLPVDGERLAASLGHAEGKARLADVQAADPGITGRHGMIGRSAAMLGLYSDIEKASHVDAPVMIGGESGTGKELVARAIHRLSPRRNGPFVAVNCAALPTHLIQAELYGHEKGAFTGAHQRKIGRLEAASGGTVFLDEIGDLPLELQVNLLHGLQDRVIERLGSTREIQLDVRVIAASHVELEQAVREGRFRADLYYRINVLRLHSPPLRERDDDIDLLAHAYFDRFSAESRGTVRGFSGQAMKVMANYDWPGNVRELINRVRQAVILSENRLLTPGDLGLEKRVRSSGALTLEEARWHTEREAVRGALRRNRNNVTEAARQLGISRATFYRLLDRVSSGQTPPRSSAE